MVSHAALQALTPLSLVRPAERTPQLFDAVMAMYHAVLPNVGRRFMRKYLSRAHIHTLVLLLPEAPADDCREAAQPATESEPESESESASDADGSEQTSASDRSLHGEEEHSASIDRPDGHPPPGAGGGVTPPSLTADVADARRRLVGCVSFEYGTRLGQRLVQVSLLGVSLNYQRHGVGKKLVRALLEGEGTPARPEAAIAWADHRAVPFFRQFGFSDDAILCARYREISEPWERSVLMSAQLPPPLPPLSDGSASTRWVEEAAFEEQIAAWRHSRLLEYSKELALVERLQAEIRMLREKVVRQQGHAAYLAAENAQLKRDKLAMRKELDAYRHLRSTQYEADAEAEANESAVPPATLPSTLPSTPPSSRDGKEAPMAATSPLIEEEHGESELHAELQEQLSRCKPGVESAIFRLHRSIAPCAADAARLQLRYERCRASLNQPELQLRLFYAAPRKELEAVLSRGFTELPSTDLGLEVYGRGWYFSKYASHAHHYNGGSSCVLIAQVAVGNAETVVRRDAGRGAPSSGFDSIVIPGRMLPSQSHLEAEDKSRWKAGGNDRNRSPVNEEYVIFDGSQALPLYILEYELAPADSF